ncbi:MAG: ribonuclease, partial [Acidobacteria bacterium]|nr:ribonuclease [Acidobacteriota bacterium]
MNKEMVISSTPHETRVAILEDDQVVEVFIEREQSRGVVGNIYKGRVSKVLPGMQSAFVDLGLERDAFLYVTDVIDPTAESLEDEDEPVVQPVPEAALAALATQAEGASEVTAEVGADDGADAEAEESAAPPAEAPAAPETTAAAPAPQNGNGQRRGGRGAERDRTAPEVRIEDLLKEGQEVVVQVVKEPLGTKGARITSHIS